MKPFLLLLAFLVPSVMAIGVTVQDSYSSINCGGSMFSCGTTTDDIVNTAGTYNVTITDDGITDFLCAIFVSGSNATVKTCIARQGLNNASCDIEASILAGNHSDYYVCPSGLNCGWGSGAIPLFGSSVTTRAFQIETNVANTQHVIFTRYNCTTGDSSQSLNTYFRTIDNKGVVCIGNNYASAVFDQYGITAMSAVSCSVAGFCEPSYNANYTPLSIINGTFCTPGCYDNTKNGGETEIDYGGVVCGNCSPFGKASDEHYPIARELQEENGAHFTAAYPFNVSYCPVSADTTGGIIGTLVILLLISVVMVFLLVIVISTIGGVVTTGIVIYLKNRRKKGR